MEREIVISNIIHEDGFNKMCLNIKCKIPTIHINIDGYNNFYEIIRGLNHEELHVILFDLFGEWICRELDKLDFVYFNARLKDVLYELPSKATMQTSIKDLIGYDLDLEKFH